MRPVIRGGAGVYPPVHTLSFKGGNAKAVGAVIPWPGAQNVPFGDCLDAWLLLVKGEPPTAGTLAQQQTAVAAIKKSVGKVYKQATVPLTQNMGAFCSYCETPLPGLTEVEHCVPEAQYPTYSLSWDNFLIACSACNTAKDNDPLRAVVDAWMNKANPTEADFYDAIRPSRYVWPDLDAECYRWMPLQLQYLDPATNIWKKAPDKWAYSTNSVVVSKDIATRTVTAQLVNNAGTSSVTAAVRVYVTGTAASNGQADKMVEHCGLNIVGNLVSTYDRRLMNRTLAWFTCIQMLKTYKQASNAAVKASQFEIMQLLAVQTGFYSVWVQCIAKIVSVAVAKTFVADTDHALAFPGTRKTYLP